MKDAGESRIEEKPATYLNDGMKNLLPLREVRV